ncbi:hypothetical protein ACH4U5_34285 [Streptomyces sp. NPDC020858]|uniref:hypothetical protein n=1 Tax=Streptomyces sp. NPDC020858 TaxID=3365097 RepID=UPI00378D9A98
MEFAAAAPAVLVRPAARGLGVAVVPSGAESGADRRDGGGLRALRITGPALNGRVSPAWRTAGPAGPAALRLLERLRAEGPGRPAP